MSEEPLPPSRILHPDRFQPFEFHNNRWSVILDHPLKIDDVINPYFWAHVEKQIRRGDEIVVRPSDYSFVRYFHVREIKPEMIIDPYDPQDVSVPDDLFLKWNVGAQGYDVFRRSDNQKVASAKTLPKRKDAEAWIEQNRVKAVA